MTDTPSPSLDLAADLLRYLQQARDAMVSKLDGLSDYDMRRPMTPTGTNLLGLIKHLAGNEFGYLGDSVGRPLTTPLPWVADGSIWDGADMWVTETETRDYIIDLYKSAWQHADESVKELGLAAPARVEWWPEERRDTTLGSLLVRTVAETAQHAGHADILRELIDGRAGRDHEDMGDAQWWTTYVAKVQAAADHFRS